MAASATMFRTFDAESEEWDFYREQLEQFFVSNVVADAMKKAVLINHLSSRTYKLLRDLCTPDQPKDKTYDELCKLLTTHFTPPVVIHKERRVFSRAKRHEGGHETVNQWIARIKNLAANCSFGNSLQNNLVNKFVDGLDGKAFDRICEEKEDLTLEKAQELALKYESDEPSATLFNVQNKSGSKQNYKTKNRIDQRQEGPSGKCLVCFKTGHYRRDCRFKEYVCKKCNKKGHLRAACDFQRNFYLSTEEQKQALDSNDANDDLEKVEFNQNYISKCNIKKIYKLSNSDKETDWFKVAVRIGGEDFIMELDSGAGLCVISEELYRRKLSQWPLEMSQLQLQLYSGEKMKVLGTVAPVLEYKGSRRRIMFAVVRERGPPLLGKNFMKAFNVQLAIVKNIACAREGRLSQLLKNYASLFRKELGCYTYGEINLELEGNEQPVFKKPRPVPFKFQAQVANELDKMENTGVITKCDSSAWGTPLVPVVKPDGSIRLCGDYKVTLNSFLKEVKHPLPTADEIFVKLNGGSKFSKLDLSKAYNQFVLNDRSKEMCSISTMQGVYRMNRLPFGVKPASGIVQREIEKLLCGIKGVSNFLDDVIISGATDEEHLERLEQVFRILEKAGLKLNKEKCQFFKDQLIFLGYVITKDGLKNTDERISAIRDAPEPTNLTEVRAFAGLVNYYAKFVAGLADIMGPLYGLLRKGAKFHWDINCKMAFQRIKKEICKDVTLAHFNPDAELYLTCDASNRGVSAVLCQREGNIERPVAFASRVLHPSEINYSVIDREALAIIYGINKFFLYLAGNHFCIRTDHKPLLSIFNPKKGIPAIAASRMQRWAHFLSGFSYDIGHVRSQSNIADFPSRFPVESWKIWKEDSYLNFINTTELALVDVSTLAEESLKDTQLRMVIQVLKGNSDNICLPKDNSYSKVVPELSLEKGVVMRGYRVLVPPKLRSVILANIHQSHLGIVKSKSIARSSVWWPGIDSDIERFSRNCSSCLLESSSPPRAQLMPWKPPDKIWSRIHIDFAGPVRGWNFLIIVDALSKWVEVFATKSCTAQFVLEKLTECIARFGIFDELVSDNGTQFVSSEVQNFLAANGIRQKLTSPGHPATNGEAENMVKTFKASLLKCLRDQNRSIHSIIVNFVMGYRKSVHCSTGLTPAHMMLGRDIRSSLELMSPREVLSTQNEKTATDNMKQKQELQASYYHGSRSVTFEVGENVIVRDYTNPNKQDWTPAVITKILGERNYQVQLKKSDRLIKRHMDQIKKDWRNYSEEQISAVQSNAEQLQKPRYVTRNIAARRVAELQPERNPVASTEQVRTHADAEEHEFTPIIHSSPAKLSQRSGGSLMMEESSESSFTQKDTPVQSASNTELFESLEDSSIMVDKAEGMVQSKVNNDQFISDDSDEGLEVGDIFKQIIECDHISQLFCCSYEPQYAPSGSRGNTMNPQPVPVKEHFNSDSISHVAYQKTSALDKITIGVHLMSPRGHIAESRPRTSLFSDPSSERISKELVHALESAICPLSADVFDMRHDLYYRC
ncbi:uncharacterized protein K02A2.6-like [Sabethes cyaneus]|uniref:uncharacterized protein K02A2.6-like n=1 Tax=Sabethes cyaneus TaxID=53552 RepID=UPI00237EE11C|nr:uncharacterized protein K02A2.6-like [Sabethes cyaneus]